MPSFSVKQDEDILTITERSIKAFPVNEREMEILSKYHPPYLFKPVLEKTNRIKYTAPSSVVLMKYIRNSMNEHRLFGLLTRLLGAIAVLNQYDLAVSNLILDENMIYINELTENIYLIYRPLNERNSGGNIYRFLDNLVIKIKKYNKNIDDICDDLHAFLSDPKHYKVYEITDYIKRVYPSIYREIKMPKVPEPTDSNNESNKYDEQTATSFLNISDEKEIDKDDLGNKTIFKIVSPDNLISFEINKDIYVIGKSKEKADGVISGNNMISRMHAEIMITDSHAYIKDLNSANGTFVDGRKIEADKKVLLNKNSIIKLADQELVISDSEGFFKGDKITQKIIFMNMKCQDKDHIIAYEIARNLAQNNKKVLFISTDILQSAGYFVNKFKTMTTDMITILKTDKNSVFRNAMNCLIHDGNMDLFPLFPGPLWEYNLDRDFYVYVVNEASNTGIYDFIITENKEPGMFVSLSDHSDKAFIIAGKDDYMKYLTELMKAHLGIKLDVISENDVDEVYKKICQTL